MVGPPPRALSEPGLRRNLLLLLAAIVGLVAVRWAATGGPSRPLAPPGSLPRVTTPPPDLRVLRGNLLYMGGRQPLLVDPVSGSVTALAATGAGRIRILRQGGFMVMFARDGAVAVQPANGSAPPRALGQASDVLLSPDPDRIWLVAQQSLTPDQTFVLRELDLRNGRPLRRWTLPYDAEPVAIVPQGVVVRDLQNNLEVRDPARHGTPLHLGFDLTLIDVHGSQLAFLDEDGSLLHFLDLASDRRRALSAPAGARSWLALGPPLPGTGCCQQLGAFSPDGARLAVFTELAGPGAPGLTMVDIAAGRASLLAGSAGATPVACQPCLGWSRSGWLFFFNGGPGVADPAAWRPGQRAAISLTLDLRSMTTVLPSSLAAA